MDEWLDKTSHLKMWPWALGNCNRKCSLLSGIVWAKQQGLHSLKNLMFGESEHIQELFHRRLQNIMTIFQGLRHTAE